MSEVDSFNERVDEVEDLCNSSSQTLDNFEKNDQK